MAERLYLSDYFEEVVKASNDPRASRKLGNGRPLGAAERPKVKKSLDSPVSAENLGKLVALIGQGKLSGKMAKEVFAKMASSGDSADAIVAREGLTQISDESALAKIIDEVIAANPKQVEQYKSGKTTVIGFFVGQVKKASRGQAEPGAVNKLLQEKLS